MTQTDNAWAIGDVVRLRSGGPSMTIRRTEISPSEDDVILTTFWFNSSDELQTAYFPARLVNHVPGKKS